MHVTHNKQPVSLTIKSYNNTVSEINVTSEGALNCPSSTLKISFTEEFLDGSIEWTLNRGEAFKLANHLKAGSKALLGRPKTEFKAVTMPEDGMETDCLIISRSNQGEPFREGIALCSRTGNYDDYGFMLENSDLLELVKCLELFYFSSDKEANQAKKALAFHLLLSLESEKFKIIKFLSFEFGVYKFELGNKEYCVEKIQSESSLNLAIKVEDSLFSVSWMK